MQAGCAAMAQATLPTGTATLYNPAYAAVSVVDTHDFLGDATIQAVAALAQDAANGDMLKALGEGAAAAAAVGGWC